MGFFQHRYYRTVRILLTISGYWPNQPALLTWGIGVFLVIVGVTHIIPLIIVAVRYSDDIALVLQVVLVLNLIAVLYIKGICFKWNIKKIHRLLNRIRSDWQVWTQDKDVTILHDYAEQGRKMSAAWVVVFLSTAIIFTMPPAILKIIDKLMGNGSMPGAFPIPIDYYYFDKEEYFFSIIAHEAVSGCMGFLYVMASDCFFIVSVQHGCGIFASLGHKLSKIGKNDESAKIRDSACLSDNENMNLEQIAWCIRRHHDAIEYAQLIDSIFSWSFFFTVGLNMFVISISGYQIAKNTTDTQEFAKSTLGIVIALGHIYFESYMAQMLMDHSISIGYSLQSSKWYKESPKVQKLLYVMMIRCNVSCQLTVGKMAVMCFEFFASIVKTSMSCLTVLRSM